MAAGNITCIIAAACLTYLPSDQKWNRLVAFWFTSFQVGASESSSYFVLTYVAQSVGFALSLVMISNNVSACIP